MNKIVFAFVAFLANAALALTGTVIGTDSLPLSGVTVALSNAGTSTQTLSDGTFELSDQTTPISPRHLQATNFLRVQGDAVTMDLPEAMPGKLRVVNTLGTTVFQVAGNPFSAGSHKYAVFANHPDASGMFFVSATIGGRTESWSCTATVPRWWHRKQAKALRLP